MKIVLHNRQRKWPFDLAFVRAIATAAIPACLEAAKTEGEPLLSCADLEVSLVSDSVIAQVHDEFFNDPSATDVITFAHGELLIGAGVITANAAEYGLSPSEECALCVIHGMLHLAGWNDLDGREAAAMKRRQERIFKNARAVVH